MAPRHRSVPWAAPLLAIPLVWSLAPDVRPVDEPLVVAGLIGAWVLPPVAGFVSGRWRAFWWVVGSAAVLLCCACVALWRAHVACSAVPGCHSHVDITFALMFLPAVWYLPLSAGGFAVGRWVKGRLGERGARAAT